MNLEGKRCLVTGCSSGIGRALVVSLAQAGAKVIATARREESIRGLRAENVTTAALDVTDPAGVHEVVTGNEPVDVLVNNAGYGLLGAVEEVADDELRAQYETNLFGPWRLCRAVLPGMRERRSGVIVNISSVGGQAPFPGIGAYRSSKAAMELLSWTLHYEVSHFGIRVLDVQPGLVASNFDGGSIRARGASNDGPYQAMRDIAEAAYPLMSPVGMEPSAVASEIVTELQKNSGPLRLRIGDDARRVLARVQAGDEAYERFMVDELQFRWHPR